MTGSIRNSIFVLNKLLRDNVTSVKNRVFPPGIQQNAQTPRISLHSSTPVEKLATIAPAAGGTFQPVWRMINYRIDIFSVEPNDCDTVADEVMDTIASNRYYKVASIVLNDRHGGKSTVASNGYFSLLRVNGGTETAPVPAYGKMYHRTVNVIGRWFQSGTAN